MNAACTCGASMAMEPSGIPVRVNGVVIKINILNTLYSKLNLLKIEYQLIICFFIKNCFFTDNESIGYKNKRNHLLGHKYQKTLYSHQRGTANVS